MLIKKMLPANSATRREFVIALELACAFVAAIELTMLPSKRNMRLRNDPFRVSSTGLR